MTKFDKKQNITPNLFTIDVPHSSNSYYTHRCAELSNLAQNGTDNQVTIAGWIHRVRDHGNLLFIELRDYTGIVQCVVSNSSNAFQQAQELTNETVVQITGIVRSRPESTANLNLKTGTIELNVDSINVISKSAILPFLVHTEEKTPEEMRLQYRFLDLRRERMRGNMILRSKIIKFIRDTMWKSGFLEMQTPILTASSPEGARDYVVPSRLHRGKFYALPQAPQQFKQLIMASGFERYFQIAPCFRDEDSRADRLPGEFYQLDIEMAFATQENIFCIVEPIIRDIFEQFSDKPVSQKFHRITYKQALNIYASDKPDLRNKLVVNDVTELFKKSNFKIFANAIENGAQVKAIAISTIAGSDTPILGRKLLDELNSWAQSESMAGLGYVLFQDGEVKGPIAKQLNKARINALATLVMQAKAMKESDSFAPPLSQNDAQNSDTNFDHWNTIDSDGMNTILKQCNFNDDEACDEKHSEGAVFFICSDTHINKLASAVRNKLGETFKQIDNDRYEFCWITDFPFYELDENGNVGFSHNPFSMPRGGMKALLEQNPLEIIAEQYDIACNGLELSSGAIRNHMPEIMYKAFEIAGYDNSEVDRQFGALIKAFQYGVPPHGGIAPGIDRIIMLLTGAKNLREVTLYPLNQQAQDILMGAPSPLNEKQLKELGLKIIE
jgi:aspartyl-tRNA synthetase